MINPFEIISDFATLVVDVMEENEQIRSRQIARERTERENKKAKNKPENTKYGIKQQRKNLRTPTNGASFHMAGVLSE